MISITGFMEAQKGFASLEPASDLSVSQAEEKLGLLFADDYKQYVRRYGAVSFMNHELTGISSAPSLDVVAVTMQQRSIHPEIPLDRYVIEQANIDGIVFWQDRSGAVFRNHEKKYNSLLAYLSQ